MLILLLALLPFINSATASTPPACKVVANPHVALAPLRSAVIIATIEPQGSDPDRLWTQADVVLIEDGLEIRSSRLWEGDSALKAPRTSRVEWKALGLAGGVYDVVLVVRSQAGECRASDRLIVQGETE